MFVGEFLAPFFAALVLFTAVVVFSGVAPSLRYLRHPAIQDVVSWVAWQFPAYIVQAMPIAVAFAALVSVGALVRRREMLAMSAGGVDPRRPIAMLVVVGVGLALLGLAISQWAVPAAATRITETWWPMTSGQSGLYRLAGHTWFMGTGELHVGKVAEGRMLDVRFTRRERGTVDVYFAASAGFDGRDLVLHQVRHVVLKLGAVDRQGTSALELGRLVPVDTWSDIARIPTTGTEHEWLTRYSGATYEDGRSLTSLWASAHNEYRTPVARFQDMVTFYRKLVEPIANIAILMVAVPLAVRYAGSTVLSFGLTLAVAVAWYLSLAGSEIAARAGLVPAITVVWLVLAPFVVVGAVLAPLAGRP